MFYLAINNHSWIDKLKKTDQVEADLLPTAENGNEKIFEAESRGSSFLRNEYFIYVKCSVFNISY